MGFASLNPSYALSALKVLGAQASVARDPREHFRPNFSLS
jgi:hypothetical protein